MIDVRLAASLGRAALPRGRVYQFGRGVLTSDLALRSLAPFALPDPGRAPMPHAPITAVDTLEGRRVRGWLAGGMRDVTCHGGGGGGQLIHVQGIGRFAVGPPAGHIRCLSLAPDLARARVEEALLGPAVAMALAMQGSWCLHASAVARDDGALLFLGDSGAGKSTLARYCDGRAGFVRVADDILPCSCVDAVPRAHPHFPQLKLAPADHYPTAADPDVRIAALIFLDSGQRDGVVEISAARRVESVRRLAEQTVAVGLFDRTLQVRHLRFVARLLASVPAYLLGYPRGFDRLPAVCAALAEQIPADPR